MQPIPTPQGAGAEQGATRAVRAARPWLLVGICAAAVAVVVALAWQVLRSRGGPPGGAGIGQRESLAAQFPDAPAGYGVLPGGAVPRPDAPCPPPAFSWVGKVDATGLNFAASRRGHRFYAIDDPRAALIRREDFVGYPTAAAARDAGKTPAP